MKVLVTAASKYGATAEIAAAIGDTIAKHGIEVTVRPMADYAGHWLKAAREFVERHADALMPPSDTGSSPASRGTGGCSCRG